MIKDIADLAIVGACIVIGSYCAVAFLLGWPFTRIVWFAAFTAFLFTARYIIDQHVKL